MKKYFISLLMMAAPVTIMAQFQVLSDGSAKLLRTQSSSYSYLGVGSCTDWLSQYGYKTVIHANCPATLYGTYKYGVYSGAAGNNGSGRAIGVLGQAGFATSGWNYGVIGGICDDNVNGAGIFGTTNHNTGVYVGGRYAGYFDGDAYVTGTLTSYSLVTPSDIRLKENVVQLSSEEKAGGETLANIMDMNIVKYNYLDRPSMDSDTAQVTVRVPDATKKQLHYGLIAQELQEIYPDLVIEGQDGYLGVNYVELVPILIRSIQELKQELDDVKDGGRGNSRTETGLGNSGSKQSILYQNTPNPFNGQSTIRFELADNVKEGTICVFDLQGKLIKKYPVTSAMDSITINGYEFSEGIYLYSLVVNGVEIDTKRMFLSKK